MPRPKRPEEEHAFKQSVPFTPEQYEKVIQYCQKHQRSISWVIRQALAQFLEKHKDDPADWLE